MRPAEEIVQIESLLPWDQNPRVNDGVVDKLVRVIERFGFLDPILVRRSDRRIIAGHRRIKAAKKMGLTEVPAILLDLDDDEARDLAVAHNRAAEDAEWDPLLLAQLVGEGLDLPELGFESSEIDALLAAVADPEVDDQEEAPAPVRVASFTLHLWPADELEQLVAEVALPGESRAATCIRGLRTLQALRSSP